MVRTRRRVLVEFSTVRFGQLSADSDEFRDVFNTPERHRRTSEALVIKGVAA
jgi:hypothetical protein